MSNVPPVAAEPDDNACRALAEQIFALVPRDRQSAILCYEYARQMTDAAYPPEESETEID
jgi:hypothetical protein